MRTEMRRSSSEDDIDQERLNATDTSQRFLLRIQSITKKYASANDNALTEMSLAVPHGECIGLLGPNGAGKVLFYSSGVLRVLLLAAFLFLFSYSL